MNRAYKKRTTLTKGMSEIIRTTRIKKKLTQKDISEQIHITVKKYSKYETREVKSIETEILLNILNVLGLEMDDVTKRLDSRCSFTISCEMKNELEFLKNYKNLDTLTDVIKYCIRFTLDSTYKNKISVGLLEEIKEILDITYNEQMKKMSLDLEIKNLILESMNNQSTYELNKIQNQLKNIFLNYSHVKNE